MCGAAVPSRAAPRAPLIIHKTLVGVARARIHQTQIQDNKNNNNSNNDYYYYNNNNRARHMGEFEKQTSSD